MLAAAPLALLSNTAQATDATWTGATGDYGLVSNWNSTVPDGTATFDSSGITKNITVSSVFGGFYVGGWTFNSGNYQFNVSGDNIALGFNGAGIVVNGGSAAITTDSYIRFGLNSTAGSATITVNSYGSTVLGDTASGGTARFILNGTGKLDISGLTSSGTTAGSIEGNGSVVLGSKNLAVGGNNLSTTFSGVIGGSGGSLTKQGTGTLTLSGANTYTGATTVNGGTLALSGTLASSQITANSYGTMDYVGSATAGNATITAAPNGVVNFNGTSTADNATFNITGSGTNQGSVNFGGTSTAGTATINNISGELSFGDTSTAGNATITNDNSLVFASSSTAGNATITNNGALSITNTATAGGAAITNNGTLSFFASSTAGNAAITNNFQLAFFNTSTAGSATITTNSGGTTSFQSTASGGTARLILKGTGVLDISGLTNSGTTAGSIEDDGSGNSTIYLGSKNLAVGGNDLSTTFSGLIFDFGLGGSLTKEGTGTLTLTGANTYTGGTTINAGTITIGNDSALGTGDVTMAAGTTLGFAGDYTLANNFGLTGDPTFFVDTGNADTISGVISDTTPGPGSAGVVEKTGTGTLILSGANTYTGATNVNAGTLELAAGGSLASPTLNLNAGTFQLSGGTLTGTPAVNLSGGSFRAAVDAVTNVYAISVNGTASAISAASGKTLDMTASVLAYFADSKLTFGSATDTGTVILTSNGFSHPGNFSVDVAGGTLKMGSAFTALTALYGTAGDATNIDGTLDANGFDTRAGNLTGSGIVTNAGASAAILTVNSNAQTDFSGTITDGASQLGLTKEGTGDLVLSGTNTYTGATNVNAGTLSVNGSIASSSLLTVNASGTIGGNGDLPSTVIASGGTLAPGNSIGTVTVNGDLNLASGSVYAVQVSPSAADETIVTGNATIAGSLTTTFANGSYAPGTTYTLINAGGSLSGTFTSTSTINLPYSYAAQFSYDPNNVFLTLLPVVDPRGGQIYASRTTTAIADERMIRDAVLGHLTSPADGVSIWGQGFIGYGKFNNAAIAHHHSGGIAGIDAGLDGGFRVGLAGAYTASKTSIPAYMARATGESGHVIGYASWSDGDVALRGGAAFGWGSSDVTRTAPSLSETDRSSQPGRTTQVFADAGYSIPAAGGILEPHAGLVWVHASSDAFHETGGTFSSFSGAGTSASATFVTLGIRAMLAEIPLGPISVAPRFDLGWQHGFDLSRPRQSLMLNSTGKASVISGVAIDSDAATAEVGADIDFAPDLTLHVGYDGLMASNAFDNAVTASLGWSF